MLYDNHRGQTICRIAIARALGGQRQADVIAYAEQLFGRSDPATRILKASAGSTVPGADWGPELATYAEAAAEFFDAVAAVSITGRLTGLRRVPLAVRTIAISSGASAQWVGQGDTKPITNALFAAETLPPLKLAAICVETLDLLRLADTQAEDTIRNDLVRAVAVALDMAFIDPANTGTPNLTPASVTSGVTPIAATGNFRADLATLIADFEGDLEAAFFVGHPALFANLAGADHPLIGARGGELVGIPSIASSTAPAGDSPNTYDLVLIDPTAIAIGDDLPSISTATHASILMVDEAGDDEGELVSLWQSNCAAIRVELPTNWRATRPAVSIQSGIVGAGDES